jgi:glucose uptake protein GlcU
MSTGYFYALAAFACIGSYMVPVRFATSKGLKFMPFMGLGMVAMDLLRHSSLQALWAHPRWFWASLLSGVLWVAGQALANLALEEVSLAKGAVLFNFNSFINIAFGLLVFHEASGFRAYAYLLAGGLLLFTGAAWVSRISAAPAKEGNLKKGVGLGLLAGLFWGLYFTPIKAAQVWDPQPALSSLDALSGLALGGTLPALALFFFCRKGDWSIRNILLGGMTTFLWAVGTACFLLAIDGLGLSRAVPIVNSNGLVYAAWSLFVFKEFSFSAWPKVLGGTVIVVAGVILMAFSG